ncbi:formin-I-like [Helianthus annuus]|uniref:formin-I-like n=1 Tax=Helianthus annuus TaxID=4232 RepID=UPI000B8F8462|nr:formin-I-like [Helianthus annuus]
MPPRRDTFSDNPSTDELITSLADSVNKLITSNTAAFNQMVSGQEQHKAHLDIIIKQLAAQYEQTNNLITTFLRPDPNRPNSSGSNTPPPPPPPPRPPPANHTPKPPKITLPMFDGSNPLDWLFQANNYFTYYSIPDVQ